MSKETYRRGGDICQKRPIGEGETKYKNVAMECMDTFQNVSSLCAKKVLIIFFSTWTKGVSQCNQYEGILLLSPPPPPLFPKKSPVLTMCWRLGCKRLS